jgi:NADH-quinone oxidoreductase subunit G
VYRLRPRDNEAVNKFWMCDDGMMTYKHFHEERIIFGRVRTPTGRLSECDPADAISAAAEALKGVDGARIAVVLSAHHSSEDNYALVKLANALGAHKRFLAANAGWEGDTILRHADNNPNRAGAELVAGGALGSTADLVREVSEGLVDAVVALGSVSAETAEELYALHRVRLISLTSNEGALPSQAGVIVPVAVHAETFGTFVNAKGMAQQWKRAIFAPEGVLPAWQAIAAIGKLLAQDLALNSLKDVRAQLPAPKAAASAPPVEAQV